MATTSVRPADAGYPRGGAAKGGGWVLFAGIMIAMLGVLNVIYGIAAIGNAHFFVHGTNYVFGSLNTWGWVTLFIGIFQLFVAYSIWSGGAFGRWAGIAIASLNAITALLSIPAYPFWSLAIFAVDVLIVYGLAAYGGDPELAR
ncbi:MAG TPA: hypothetical protein VF032_20915 [Thermoleophilaceae bacterium]